MLAVIDNNFNIAREQATTADWTKRWLVHWSKATNSFVAKKMFVKKSYDFRNDLLTVAIQQVEECKLTNRII